MLTVLPQSGLGRTGPGHPELKSIEPEDVAVELNVAALRTGEERLGEVEEGVEVRRP